MVLRRMVSARSVAMAARRYCANCGTSVDVSALHCDNCGIQLSTGVSAWSGVDSAIGRVVEEVSRGWLDAYKVQPLLVTEQANIERATAQGGYGRRQIYELVQNGADALLESS